MFAGIYYGAMYGGSTTSILLNTPGEIGLHRHRDGRQHDGQARPGGTRARHGRDRLVRRRHAGDDRAHAAVAAHRRHRAQVRARRVLRADGAGVHHGVGRARVVAAARDRRAVLRAVPGPDRDRLADRPGAVHARHPGTSRRHRRGRRGRGAVRGRRDALRGDVPQSRRRSSRKVLGLGDDERARIGRAHGSRGCAAPRSAFRSARCRRAARRSRRSCPMRSSGS